VQALKQDYAKVMRHTRQAFRGGITQEKGGHKQKRNDHKANSHCARQNGDALLHARATLLSGHIAIDLQSQNGETVRDRGVE
jgi:hypothetical protein